MSRFPCQPLIRTADAEVKLVMQRWREVALSAKVMQRREDLGWMNSNDYLSLAKHSLKRKVLAPLRARGIPVSDHDEALAEL